MGQGPGSAVGLPGTVALPARGADGRLRLALVQVNRAGSPGSNADGTAVAGGLARLASPAG
eukprot:5774984-Lingulodinium_polyedra.AAC.1